MSSLKVPTSKAGRVRASVHGTDVVEGADGANSVDGGTSRGDVAVAPAVLALHVPIGGVSALNRS